MKTWVTPMELMSEQTWVPCLAQQREPASALASVPYSDLPLVPAMVRYWDHAMVRAWVQTKAPRSVRQRVPALALASAPYSAPL